MREFPLLCRAAAETGSVATQNRGTLGGNIANASPAADSPPALMVYDAEIEMVSAAGRGGCRIDGFHIGLQANEFARRRTDSPDSAAAVRMPGGNSITAKWERGGRRRFRRFALRERRGWRRAGSRMCALRLAASRLPFCARSRRRNCCVGEKLRRQRLCGLRRRYSAREIAPIDDMRSTARYRRRVARNLLAEFLEVLAG